MRKIYDIYAKLMHMKNLRHLCKYNAWARPMISILYLIMAEMPINIRRGFYGLYWQHEIDQAMQNL